MLVVGDVHAHRADGLPRLRVQSEVGVVRLRLVKLVKLAESERFTDDNHLLCPHIEILRVVDIHRNYLEIKLIFRQFGGTEGDAGETLFEGGEILSLLVARFGKHRERASLIEDAGGEVESGEVAFHILAVSVAGAEGGQYLQESQ